MPEFPQLPLHVQRWLSELSDLTLEEHGAYFLTIMHMWLQPDSGMPDDPEWLRKKLHVHARKWRRLWPIIRSFMTEIDGRLYQKTLGEERQYLREKRAKSSANANKRWEIFRANQEMFRANQLKNNNVAHASQHSISDAPTPTPTPTPLRKKDSCSSGDERFRIFWEAYPRKVGKKAAEKAFKKAITETTLEVMLRALAIDKGNWREERFTPHPATWLNQGRYLDHAEGNERKPYRPPGYNGHDQQGNAGRDVTKASDVLDQGTGIRDEERMFLGDDRSFHPRVRRMD